MLGGLIADFGTDYQVVTTLYVCICMYLYVYASIPVSLTKTNAKYGMQSVRGMPAKTFRRFFEQLCDGRLQEYWSSPSSVSPFKLHSPAFACVNSHACIKMQIRLYTYILHAYTCIYHHIHTYTCFILAYTDIYIHILA
jgi:hypothetical protein